MKDKPVYTNLMPLAAFPLGGIGTGSVTLHASSALTEFEVFNRPTEGNKLPYSFFCMHSEWGDRQDTRVLEAMRAPDFSRARGYHPHEAMGLPRFPASQMEVAFPFARVSFEDDSLPLSVGLEAFTPFIPLEEDDSGIPAVSFRYTVRNDSNTPATVLLALSMPNILGLPRFDCFENYLPFSGRENVAVEDAEVAGVFMGGGGVSRDSLEYADCSIVVPREHGLVSPQWYQGGWYDGVTEFWRDFTNGRLGPEAKPNVSRSAIGPAGYPVGSAGIRKVIQPGEEEEFRFILSWYVPNRHKGWFPSDNPGQTMKNHYATRFGSSLEAAKYLYSNLPRLERQSRLFSDALYGSTLPDDVIEAVANNLTVLTSNTCFRDETGTFLAWEGCHEQEGSCHGTCTHVWNYAQGAAWLFPALERSARLNEFRYEVEPDGKMNFRAQKRFGLAAFDMHAAADGQLGTIVRAWREYTLSGDKAFLEEVYPQALKCLEYAEKTWDLDGDLLLEGLQHNTYDIEFLGANPLSGVMYLGALRAAGRMADVLGDHAASEEMRRKSETSGRLLDEKCFNGSYYVQSISDVDRLPYQFGAGCLSDQLLGQALAHWYGLGYLLPKEHVSRAARAVFDNNFLDGTGRGACLQRLYVAQDEVGLVLCTWPNGGKPRFPFVYSDEVWTGVEYHVASLLIMEGYVAEGLSMVSTVRDRYDGVRRNPFSEMECGHHYARSLASYGVLLALSGLSVSPQGSVTFAPAVNRDDFHCFYCDGRSFGILHQTVSVDGRVEQRIEPLYMNNHFGT